MRLFAEHRKLLPDPRQSSPDGIVDINDDVRVERLFEAYSFGIFPWPHEDLPTLWYCPKRRGVLDFRDLHLARSLRKELKKNLFTFSLDTQFAAVIEACSQAPRPGQTGTWLSRRLIKAYIEFHRAGYAHSLEVWRDGELAGGLYGVYVGGIFCGESMFFKYPDASKFALVSLVEFLKGEGLTWIDIQMVTPVLKQFGGKYIARERFLSRLESAKASARAIVFKKT